MVLLGFGVVRLAQRKEGDGAGHTWWILVAGKGLAEDVKSGAAARPVAAAAAREGRPNSPSEAEAEKGKGEETVRL